MKSRKWNVEHITADTKKVVRFVESIAGANIMAGLSYASGLKTQIKSYTETDSNVLTDAVLENIILKCTI